MSVPKNFDISLSEDDGDELPPAPEDASTSKEDGTGHSRQLRRRLRAARERLGLTQGQVAEKVGEVTKGRAKKGGASSGPGTASSIGHYEEFRRHPRIDVMAAWARAVGLRLIVDLDDAKGNRIPVMLNPRTAELARVLDNASDADFEMARTVLYRLLKVEPEE